MTPIIVKTIQLLLSLSMLIILHECGHFIPAKLFKTRVEKFFLFFDIKFSLFKKKIGDTVFGIGWLPLGGYVKISGMMDESMDTEQLKKPPEPWEFRSKPAWQRLIIMLGGVIVNFIVGFLIYMMIIFVWGTTEVDQKTAHEMLSPAPEMEVFGFHKEDKILEVDGEGVDVMEVNKQVLLRGVKAIKVKQLSGAEKIIAIPDTIGNYIVNKGFRPFVYRIPPVIEKIIEGSPASIIGLETGAVIEDINGIPMKTVHDVVALIGKTNVDSLTVGYLTEAGDRKTNVMTLDENKKMGIYFKTPQISKKEYNLSGAIAKGYSYGYWTIYDYVAELKYIFTTEKGIKGVGGFAAIGNLFPSVWDWQQFWERTAFLSIVLAVLNLLPIPALDGGHVVFLMYEIITRRKPHEKVLEYAQIAGFLLLIGLALYANGNDVYRFLIK